jgi:hypothetical protein
MPIAEGQTGDIAIEDRERDSRAGSESTALHFPGLLQLIAMRSCRFLEPGRDQGQKGQGL